MNPETQLANAQHDEANALVASLRDRTVVLNLEIRSRDARIAELEQRIVELEAAQ